MKQALSALVAILVLSWAAAAQAQSTFVQIEALPSLANAQQRARVYSERLSDVNGFQLGSGWYSIALGPYTDSEAIERLGQLRRRGVIPADSYLSDGTSYRRQFWPVGANALTARPGPQPPEGGAATAQGQAQAAVVQTAPPPPDETRAEARRSELRLTRDERADLQIALRWFGFYDGGIDAAFGPGTRRAMEGYQLARGFEPTGILTTRQRDRLRGEYQKFLASIGFQTVRDDTVGIEIELPMAMVEFEHYEPPFAHYVSKNDSGVRVLLISRAGDESSLLGLFDIMQTLRIVPLEGFRERKRDEFTLTGQNDRITSYTHAVLDGGHVKGFTLIWPAGEDRRRDLVLAAMRETFKTIPGRVLPETVGDGALEQSIDLVSGLEIRRPDRSRSGFYIDGRGAVLTTAEAVEACGRITIEGDYEAAIVARDAALGLALLRPSESLAPMDYARFQPGVPRLQSEIAVSGYSYDGILSAPTLTFGTLADVRGLGGEESVKRLALAAKPGDAGGPVFDTSGSVLGMLLPPESPKGQKLPADVSFAADAEAIARFLSDNGVSPAASDRDRAMSAEALTRLAANLTVLVSCWK